MIDDSSDLSHRPHLSHTPLKYSGRNAMRNEATAAGEPDTRVCETCEVGERT